MSLPKLSDQQIARVIQQVATYIEQQRQIYRGVAAPWTTGRLEPCSPSLAHPPWIRHE
jgi:hypothetical protein